MNLRLAVRRGLSAIRVVLERLGKAIYQSEYERNRDRWYADNGDLTIRLDYPDLTPDSMVFDLGGWQGNWASDIYAKYNCHVHVFEPVLAYADAIAERFSKNAKIEVFKCGLAGQDDAVEIFLGSEGSSTTRNHNNKSEIQTIKLRAFSDFVAEHGIDEIDLIKINIEGGEFELLEHITQSDAITRIKHLQIQFHDFIPGAVARRQAIRQALERTHTLTYDYPFVWEGWSRS